MKNRVALLLSVGLLFSSLAAAAAPKAGEKLSIKIFEGTFTSENGETAALRVADGGFVRITNREKDLHFELAARGLVTGEVELTVRQYADQEHELLVASDVFRARMDGKSHSSEVAPFRVALSSARTQLATFREGGAPKPGDPSLNAIACCISCGGWELCCGISLGTDFDWICCEIGMCGVTCTICEWWEQAI